MKEASAALVASALPARMVLVGILPDHNGIHRLDGLRPWRRPFAARSRPPRTQVHNRMMLMGIGNELERRIFKLEEKS